MKSTCLFIFAILIAKNASCQNETSKWYFGVNAGLDFMTSPPTILTNGALVASDGSASLADGSGNLVFYTDGATIWNNSHMVMPNGTGLIGNNSTTQSAMIVKQPGQNTIFFVFSLGAGGNSPLNFSTVDMSLSAGAGSITIKNTLLNSNCTEKLTAINHCNGKDVWVLAHRSNSSDFLAYLVTAAGVNTTAVISTIGSAASASFFGGYLKISPNGRKAATYFATFEMYDFDNSTGIFSNVISFPMAGYPYGCEFSPDGTKLYGTPNNDGSILQWDLCAGSPTAIAASQYTVLNASSTQREALQLAKDGKIYVARVFQQTLGVINNPNVLGSGCNYVDLGQSISPKQCQWGLPNFNASYFRFPPPTFTAAINPTMSCQTSFSSAQVPTICSAAGPSVTGISWFFGEPVSGANNTSTLANPVHVFSGPGTYTVKQTFNTGCATDTLRQVVTINGPTLSISATPNFTLCSGNTITLTASGADTYSWNTGSTTTTIPVSPTITTSYTITGTNTVSSCAEKKVITVTVSKCLGVEKFLSDNSISIYPNPTKGEFTVRTASNIHLEIFNQFGEKIAEYQLETGTHTLELKGAVGIYFIRAINSNGVFNYKLVKIG